MGRKIAVWNHNTCDISYHQIFLPICILASLEAWQNDWGKTIPGSGRFVDIALVKICRISLL